MGAFDGLELEDKIQMIQKSGELIMQISYFEYHIALYSLDRKMVEVYFNTANKEFVNILSVSYAELDKYIKHVDISAVL